VQRCATYALRDATDGLRRYLIGGLTEMSWQRANLQAAASYLRDRLVAGATDVRTKVVYQGLLDVLEPARRTIRLQREAASAAQKAVAVPAARERRAKSDRRAADRRRLDLGSPTGVERRSGGDRRGRDRRARS
jgi:hypothetical protein